MQVRALLPSERSLHLDSVEIDRDHHLVRVQMRSVASACPCPACSVPSQRVHSTYARKLSDLPWQGYRVQLTWRVRRLFCDNVRCSRKIFAEQHPEIAMSKARRTERLMIAMRCVAFACGGALGARLAERLGIQVSGDTLLRSVHTAPVKKENSAGAIGVDDWAYRKGQRYGTLICDLQTGRVLDLLPDRDADSLARWLKQQDNVQTIARDRSDVYRKGSTLGAPQAVQVADRFHLVKNLREAFQEFLDGRMASIREALAECKSTDTAPAESTPVVNRRPTRSQDKQAESRQRRQARYERVMALHQRGSSARAIARQCGMNRDTVRMYLQSEGCPERAHRSYSSSVSPFASYLRERWDAGETNGSRLWTEIVQQGFQGAYSAVRRFVRRFRTDMPANCPTQSNGPKLSSYQVSWLFFRPHCKLSDAEVRWKSRLLDHRDQIQTAWAIVEPFLKMVREKSGAELEPWYQRASSQDAPASLRNFAIGLKKDWAAVVAALTTKWNNGSAEGHINRLKMIKRQMFGRAHFDLLRARMLAVV